MESELNMGIKLGLIGNEYNNRFLKLLKYSYYNKLSLAEVILYIDEEYPDLSTREKMWHCSKIATIMSSVDFEGNIIAVEIIKLLEMHRI